MNNMIKQMKIVEESEEDLGIPVLLDGGCPASSIFDSHIAFMEKKKQVEQGRKKRVKVL